MVSVFEFHRLVVHVSGIGVSCVAFSFNSWALSRAKGVVARSKADMGPNTIRTNFQT